ncbi:hypothetical protein EMCRGX_G021060 [Ephydatia muelleri]
MERRYELCQAVFKSRDAMRHHGATTHIDECVISSTIKIARTNGVFKCVCGSSSVSIRAIQGHKQCYLSHQSTLVNGTEQSTITSETDQTNGDLVDQAEQTVQSTITHETDPINGWLHDTLSKYNLTYRKEYNLDSFKCASCNHYGSSERHMVMVIHATENHENKEVVPCSVQTLTNSAFKRFFGVVNATEVSRSVQCELPVSAVVSKSMGLVLENPMRLESISEQNMFYVVIDWYPEPDSIDRFHFVIKQELLQVPEDSQHYSAILTTFKASIQGVSSVEYSFRCAISPPDNGTQKAFAHSRLRILLMNTQRCSLVFFLKNVMERGPQDLKPAEKVELLIQEAFQAPSRNTIFPFILALMESNVANNHSITADQVRAVYREALHRCQTLATELLMGVKNASVVEAWNDFVQCRIMASRDLSKDKAIRTYPYTIDPYSAF